MKILLTELEDKRVSIIKLLRSLTLLPTEIRVEYKTAITEMFPDLRRESTISDLSIISVLLSTSNAMVCSNMSFTSLEVKL